MAEMATYVGILPRTATGINNTGAIIPRGTRVSLFTDGTIIVQDNTAKGDYVTIVDMAIGQQAEVASLYGGGKVPALAAEATTVGAPAYTNTLGRWGVTTTSNVLIGKWVLPASGAGVLGEVELEN